MASSTRSDINYISASSSPVDPRIHWYRNAGTPEAEFCEPIENGESIAPPKREGMEYASALKISTYAHDFAFSGLRIFGGAERCLDINNRVRDVAIHAGFYPIGSRNAVGIKGGCRRIAITGVVHVRAEVCEVIIGDHSDQTSEMTRDITVSLDAAYPGKVRVVLGWCDWKSIQVSGDCEIQWLRSAGLFAYVAIKRAVRAVLGYKDGVKGPSWL